MILLGLTGSIGMGKSTTAEMFRDAGAWVYDADASVHGLYAPGGDAVAAIEAAFNGVTSPDGSIDRAKLRAAALATEAGISSLEAIVHPLVAQVQQRFLAQAEAAGAPFVVLDVPLLFESGGAARCTYVAVVSAPASMQRERVLARAEMSEVEFEAILAKQIPDGEKRARADFIISSAFGLDFARDQVQAIMKLMIRLAQDGSDDR